MDRDDRKSEIRLPLIQLVVRIALNITKPLRLITGISMKELDK